jgi:hypothetical protein
MIDDPIVAEVRRIRDEYARKFNYDLDAIFKDIQQKQSTSGRTYVSFPPKRPVAPIVKHLGASVQEASICAPKQG